MKTCKVCKEEKDLCYFDKILNQNTNHITIRSTCRRCRNKRTKELFFSRGDNKAKTYQYITDYVKSRPEYATYQSCTLTIRRSIYRIKAKLNGTRIRPLKLKDILLQKHFESLFTTQMNWDNYSIYWEVDHIIPALELIREGKTKDEVNAVSNIRPLQIENNRRRNRKDPSQYRVAIYKYSNKSENNR